MNRFGKMYLALICSAMVTITGCGGNTQAPAEDASVAEETVETTASEGTSADEEVASETTEETEEVEAEDTTSEVSELPAYEYSIKDDIYHEIFRYLIAEKNGQFEEASVCIPYVLEVAIDDSNPEDILFYGDFCLFNYDLEGDTLMMKSGGKFPGLMHLKKTDNGYEVTAFDETEEGEAFNDSAKEIFGEYYDTLIEMMDDQEINETARRGYITDYVSENNLPITQYQDEGWDPVVLTALETSDESSEATELPAYEYPDQSSVYYEICRYLVEEVGKDYEEANVCIPSFVEIAIDDSNSDDILVYGDYWIYNYNLDGDTLATASGGDYPGLMHLKKTDNGYEVTAFDVVADGEAGEESAKEIFGDLYDKYVEVMGDEETREKERTDIISVYVLNNELPITQYQDYGWDPVALSTN